MSETDLFIQNKKIIRIKKKRSPLSVIVHPILCWDDYILLFIQFEVVHIIIKIEKKHNKTTFICSILMFEIWLQLKLESA